MSNLGRPRALDETKQREILALISAGCGIQTAARYVGFSPRTVYREIRRDKEFWDSFRKAELASTITPLQTIKAAASTNWRAATWLLERKLPQNFAAAHRDMIDPHDLGQIFDRFFDELRRSTPNEKIRRRIMKRIERTTMVAVHESTTKRKSPRTTAHRSPLRKPGQYIPGDPPSKRPRLPPP
jgi:hypothetical protein